MNLQLCGVYDCGERYLWILKILNITEIIIKYSFTILEMKPLVWFCLLGFMAYQPGRLFNAKSIFM